MGIIKPCDHPDSERDARGTRCKACAREAQRKYREKNREKVSTRQRQRVYEPVTEGSKVCITCRETKPVDDFHRQRNAPDGRAYSCKACANTYSKDHYAGNPEYYAERRQRYYVSNRDQIRAEAAVKHRVRKAEVIGAYGGVCVCCGETNLGFLTLDHVNNDGKAHRMELGHGRASARVYAWAKANGYPSVLQVLCMNCNCGKQWNGGVCPHEEERNGPAQDQATS